MALGHLADAGVDNQETRIHRLRSAIAQRDLPAALALGSESSAPAAELHPLLESLTGATLSTWTVGGLVSIDIDGDGNDELLINTGTDWRISVRPSVDCVTPPALLERVELRQKARKLLKVKGFVAVRKGTPLYTKAKEFYKQCGVNHSKKQYSRFVALDMSKTNLSRHLRN